jgi:hypothetical protein
LVEEWWTRRKPPTCDGYTITKRCLMVFNATFNNISVISWRSVLLVEERWTRRKPPTCDGYTITKRYLMVFNATFNNISVISWQSVLLWWKPEYRENHQTAVSHWQTLSHNVVLSTPRHHHQTRILVYVTCIEIR